MAARGSLFLHSPSPAALAALLAVGFLAGSLQGPAEAGEPRCAGPGDWRNELVLPALSGDSLDCETLLGEPVVIQFWASWCSTCGELLADVDEVAAGFGSVRYLVVSIDDDAADARQALESQPLVPRRADRYYHDADKHLMRRLKVFTVPTLLVLDAAGEERLRLHGHVGTEALSRLAQEVTTLNTGSGGRAR